MGPIISSTSRTKQQTQSYYISYKTEKPALLLWLKKIENIVLLVSSTRKSFAKQHMLKS